MRYVIELWFDEALEDKILGIWSAVHTAHVKSAIRPGEGRPHVSLAIFDDMDAAAVIEALESFFAHQRVLPVTFASIGHFPGREGVWFLGPAPDPALVSLHRQLHAIIHAAGWQTDRLYRPGRWIPHCTVAQYVPQSQAHVMLELMRRVSWPLTGQLAGVQLVQVHPARELWTRRFLPARSPEDAPA